jgi:hypothetical protein
MTITVGKKQTCMLSTAHMKDYKKTGLTKTTLLFLARIESGK